MQSIELRMALSKRQLQHILQGIREHACVPIAVSSPCSVQLFALKAVVASTHPARHQESNGKKLDAEPLWLHANHSTACGAQPMPA
jgi:hypothetical protein